MSQIMKIEIDKATSDPDSVFETPTEVAEHIGLTRGQKIATLERWAFAIRARVDAVSEGMTSYPDGTYVRDTEFLREIEMKIEELRNPGPDTIRRD